MRLRLCLLLSAAGLAATAAPASADVGVALLQGEQVTYVQRPGATVQDAVAGLLAGPTATERGQEITTLVPAGVPLRGVSVAGTTATVDLGARFARGRRAERLQARIAQLVLTATRVPGIGSVRLLIEGGTPLGLFPGYATKFPLTARELRRPRLPEVSALSRDGVAGPATRRVRSARARSRRSPGCGCAR